MSFPVFSARYIRIAPDSKTAKSPLSWSTIVGMRPFGLSATYQSSFCSFLSSAIGVTLYGSSISSSAIDTFQPFGVGDV